MWLRMRLWLLFAAMFAIVYAMLSVAAFYIGLHNFSFYIFLAVGMLGFQYMIGPKIVELSMRIQYVDAAEAPDLHRMVDELAQAAGIPKPRIGVARVSIPNAFAFGRGVRDGRVCVTEGIMRLLTAEELRAVLGHEIAHLKNRDVLTIMMLSIIPMVLWYLAWNLMFSRRSRDGANLALVGLGAFLLYFITNLLVLYGSRIREYYADRGSVNLGNKPHALASALYKMVYGSARASKESLKQVEGCKAFFASDPSRARSEFSQLKEIDQDLDGTIDADEIAALRSKRPVIRTTDKMMELLSTHPNMLKRIKRLSELA